MSSNLTTHIQSGILNVTDYKRQIDQELTAVYQRQLDLAGPIDPLYQQLLEEMALFIARGGKRLRPYLTYLSYTGFGGTDIEAIRPVALSQEIIHSFALIHDDVMDRDIIRHGGSNIAGRYQSIFGAWAKGEAEHLAEAMAILAGDLSLALAFELVATSPFDRATRERMILRIKAMVFEAVAGQQLDLVMPWLPDDEVSIERLLRVCQYKTASYSFEAPLQMGAMAASASPAQLKAIVAVAQPLGIAFQLSDDMLGIFGNEDETGKPVLSDLREGKRTLLVQYGLELASSEEAKRLKGYLGNPKVGYRHLADVRAILTQSGAMDRVGSQAEEAIIQSKQAISKVGWTPDVVSALEQLADFVMTRKT